MVRGFGLEILHRCCLSVFFCPRVYQWAAQKSEMIGTPNRSGLHMHTFQHMTRKPHTSMCKWGLACFRPPLSSCKLHAHIPAPPPGLSLEVAPWGKTGVGSVAQELNVEGVHAGSIRLPTLNGWIQNLYSGD